MRSRSRPVSPARWPPLPAAALTADFDDLAADGTFHSTLTDGGIQFSNAVSQGDPNDFAVADFTSDSSAIAGKPGISAPHLLAIGASGGPVTGAFNSFDSASADGALATSAGLTAVDDGDASGDTLTLEGFLAGVQINSTSVTLTGTADQSYILALPVGVYDRFSLVASGPANGGEPLTDFDNVTINAPESSARATMLLGASLLGAAIRRRVRRASDKPA